MVRITVMSMNNCLKNNMGVCCDKIQIKPIIFYLYTTRVIL